MGTMRIEIEPKQILSCLKGDRVFIGGVHPKRVAEVVCGGIKICRVKIKPDGSHVVIYVACAHPRHGVHPRFKEVADKLKALVRETDDPCPSCQDGKGWLEPLSEQAQKQVLAAAVFGYYRGIEIPKTIV